MLSRQAQRCRCWHSINENSNGCNETSWQEYLVLSWTIFNDDLHGDAEHSLKKKTESPVFLAERFCFREYWPRFFIYANNFTGNVLIQHAYLLESMVSSKDCHRCNETNKNMADEIYQDSSTFKCNFLFIKLSYGRGNVINGRVISFFIFVCKWVAKISVPCWTLSWQILANQLHV